MQNGDGGLRKLTDLFQGFRPCEAGKIKFQRISGIQCHIFIDAADRRHVIDLAGFSELIRNGIAAKLEPAVERLRRKQERCKIFVRHADPVHGDAAVDRFELLLLHFRVKRDRFLCGARTVFDIARVADKDIAGEIAERRKTGCPDFKFRQHDVF